MENSSDRVVPLIRESTVRYKMCGFPCIILSSMVNYPITANTAGSNGQKVQINFALVSKGPKFSAPVFIFHPSKRLATRTAYQDTS